MICQRKGKWNHKRSNWEKNMRNLSNTSRFSTAYFHVHFIFRNIILIISKFLFIVDLQHMSFLRTYLFTFALNMFNFFKTACRHLQNPPYISPKLETLENIADLWKALEIYWHVFLCVFSFLSAVCYRLFDLRGHWI